MNNYVRNIHANIYCSSANTNKYFVCCQFVIEDKDILIEPDLW